LIARYQATGIDIGTIIGINVGAIIGINVGATNDRPLPELIARNRPPEYYAHCFGLFTYYDYAYCFIPFTYTVLRACRKKIVNLS